MTAEVLALAGILPQARWTELRRLISIGYSNDRASRELGLTRLQAARLDALRLAAGEPGSEDIDEAMRAAYNAFENRVEAEVVWSGLDLSSASLLRGTLATASSIAGSASSDLIVAGFQVDPRILAQIGCVSAVKRGVSLTILANDVDSSDAAVQALLASPNVRFVRASPPGETIVKFHVKAIVADGAVALIGSANFTYLGQTKNSELGVLVRGKPAHVARELLLEYATRLEGVA